MGKHKKHTKLTKPILGDFGRNEWAIIGTTCADIQVLSQKIIKGLDELKVAYIDASHDSSDSVQHAPFLTYTDKNNGEHKFSTKGDFNKWMIRPYFNEANLILINGNHFQGQRQIVVIDSKKEISLSKKLDKLANVGLVLLKDRNEPYQFLAKKIKGVPVLDFEDIEGLLLFLRKQTIPPELYGLVLMGGKSVRMGQDKGMMDYHGMPQRAYVASLLSQFTVKTYLSGRPDQAEGIDPNLAFLPDSFKGLGPYSGILSAFRKHPNKAWIVLAVDLPKMDREGLQELVDARDSSKIATAFLNPDSQFPEPLITIWEPQSYSTLLQFLAQGYSCPRKVLINADIQLVIPKDPNKLMNVNSPSDLENYKS